MEKKIKNKNFLHSPKGEIKNKNFLHSLRGEIKDSKIIERFHLHLAKKWHDKWSKIVMNVFGLSLWILVIGGIFGAGYLIRWIFNLLVVR